VNEPARKRCSKCGDVKVLAGFGKHAGRPDGHAAWCKDCANKSSRSYREKNPDAVHKLAKAYRVLESSQRAKREQQRHRRDAARAAVLSHYSSTMPPSCACCGATHRLTIDHVNGGGAQHRQAVLGQPDIGGHHFYRWLVKAGFPPGYQVLCMPCNSSKGKHLHCRLSHAA